MFRRKGEAPEWDLFFSTWTLGWTQWDWPGCLNGVRRRLSPPGPAPPTLLLTLAAAALVWIAERLRKLTSGCTFLPISPSSRALRLLEALAAVLLLLDLSGTGASRNYQATGTTVEGESYLDRNQLVCLRALPR